MALSIFKTAKTWKLIQQMNQLSVCVCVCARYKEKKWKQAMSNDFGRFFLSSSFLMLYSFLICRQHNARATDGFEYFFWLNGKIDINQLLCYMH